MRPVFLQVPAENAAVLWSMVPRNLDLMPTQCEEARTPQSKRKRSVVSPEQKCQGKSSVRGWPSDRIVARLNQDQLMRARMMSARPTRKQPNIAAINREVPSGASRNSFQMNTPQK